METYPEGFMGAVLSDEEEANIVAMSAALQARKSARAQQFTNQTRQRGTVYGTV
ncbi:unnamed protein product [Anisakis simplex]|uniref:Coat protein n=1 Tax=Anisakis simplex TaxID=6269 RepID=A0A0M3KAG1_ANISI|nr:unnamed protein product [Anisakis simplex]